jgi:tetratricopeptide (TPR) repeat protein
LLLQFVIYLFYSLPLKNGESNMPILSRDQMLEQAKMATLAGDHSEALHLLDVLLRNRPDDVEALCLKGNALELFVLAERLNGPMLEEAKYDDRMLEAKRCFETAISINPYHIYALRDFADHLKKMSHRDEALNLYDQVIDLLKARLAKGEDVEDELLDAIFEREDMLK